jgi:hypothetical protein
VSKTDLFLKTVLEGWQVNAQALGSVPEMVIQSIFPWCLTPELYADKPEYIQALSDFVRSRPAQTVPDFILQSNAVIKHDVEAQLGRIEAPTQITFGSHDVLTSTRFPLKDNIRNSVPTLKFTEIAQRMSDTLQFVVKVHNCSTRNKSINISLRNRGVLCVSAVFLRL